MKLNVFLLAAAIISLLTALLHVFGGGPEFPEIILAQDGLATKQKALYMVMWYLVTFLLVGVALVYWLGALGRPGSGAILFANAIYIAIAALFIFYGLFMLGELWTLPQWILFVAMAALAQTGQMRIAKKAVA